MIINTLSNGHIVTLKDSVTFGERRRLLAPMFENIKLDALNGAVKTSELTGMYLYEMQDRAFDLIVKSIQLPDGSLVTENLRSVVDGYTEEDGEKIYNAVSEIAKLNSTPNPLEKKS